MVGTARVSGVVMTTETTPQPVRLAIVSLHGGDRPLGRHTITDDDGRFAFELLPASRYEISAERQAFVTIPYGATKPGRPAAPLILEPGQQLENVRLLIARGAAITGVVRDESGEPIPDLDVRVESRASGSARPAVIVKTDDQGVYRAFGLATGAYFVSARPAQATSGAISPRSDAEVDEILQRLRSRRTSPALGPATAGQRSSTASPVPQRVGRTPSFVPVFHPSAFTLDDAALVSVAAGDERGGVDITLRMMTTSRVAGRVVGIGARALKEIELGLTVAGATNPSGTQRVTVRPDGTFEFAAVSPGRYLLSARALSVELSRGALGRADPPAPSSGAAGACAFAAEEVRVLGDDLPGITLSLRPCLTIAGRLEFVENATVKPPSNFSGFRVSLEPDSSAGVPTLPPWRVPAVVNAEGRFVLGEFADVLPGTYRLGVQLSGSEPGRGWWLESATVGGRDVLDAPLHIPTNAPAVLEMVLRFTDRHTSLSGVLETSSRRPASDYTVIAFPTNRDWWGTPFRRIRTARPGTTGGYLLADLPSGDYYLAALTDLAPDDWRDREFLEQIAAAAIRITIGIGEQKTQSLRVVR